MHLTGTNEDRVPCLDVALVVIDDHQSAATHDHIYLLAIEVRM